MVKRLAGKPALRIPKLNGTFGRENSRNAGEVVGDEKAGPFRGLEQRADGGEGVVAEFNDQKAARFERARGLGHELTVKFVTFLAAVEGGRGLVVADFRW